MANRDERFTQRGFAGISVDQGKCHRCKHLHKDGQSCAAFPDSIPTPILSGKFDHEEKKYPGDNGIMFEEDENIPE